jgi:cell division inhibitor SulA
MTSKYGEDLKEALFKPRLPEDDVEVPGVGTVRVRGLSRTEVMLMRKATDIEAIDGSRALVLERKMLALGMVDPQLSESEAGRWQQASAAGELDLVSDRIAQLSGMAEGAPKSGLQADGDGPGSGV